MKKGILGVVIFISIINTSLGELSNTNNEKLDVTIDFSYLSRYVDKGFECYPENHTGIRTGIDVGLYNTGFGLSVNLFRANGGGSYENAEKIDYKVYYTNRIFEDKNYATNYRISWIYHSFPDQPRHASNLQEIETNFSWPNALPFGLVPSYTVAAGWPAEGNADNRNQGGWAHIFGLGYDLTIPGILPQTDEQVLNLSAALVYNDGIGPGCNGKGGKTVDHDWSHAIFGISTKLDINKNLFFIPALYYQSSWDNSVNTSDEFYTILTIAYNF
ncbi:MAG: hypothetical protein ACYSSI_11925 [Planctomycetota bacterium]|jgi:hypothetical protein